MTTTTETSVPLQLVDLPSFIFTVATFLEGEDLLNLRLVSHGAKNLLLESNDEDDGSDAVWSLFLRRDFDGYDGRLVLRVRESHSAPSVFGTSGSDAIAKAKSAFDTWKQWKKASWRYFGGRRQLLKPTYYLRAANVWKRIEEWLLTQEITIRRLPLTFHRGISFQELPWPEYALSLSTLTATQALLAFYGGQVEHTVPWSGLLGGFSVYNFVTCTRFVGGTWVNDAAAIGECPLGRQFDSHKFIVVDSTTGQVKCQGAPNPILACPSTEPDAVLTWFEEYARRLESGYYQRGALFEMTMGPADAILHYPRQEALTRTVTRGVEVVASVVFSPWTVSHGFGFVYSIRIRLLKPQEPDYDPNRGFETCQLKSRHWQLVDESTGRTDFVDGDGVIGMYPLLREGSYRADSGGSSTSVIPGEESSETFVYQSCTGNDTSTSFRGHMLFVPGSLFDPTGPSFQVFIGPFPLDPNPDYVY